MSQSNLLVFSGEDLPTLIDICENLNPEHQEALDYNPSRTDGKDPIKTVLDKIQFAHHQRQVACSKFGKYPETSFEYYRVNNGQDETFQFYNISLFEVINGTEMMRLPCNHTFTVRCLFDFLTKTSNTLPPSWGCSCCRQGLFKFVSIEICQ